VLQRVAIGEQALEEAQRVRRAPRIFGRRGFRVERRAVGPDATVTDITARMAIGLGDEGDAPVGMCLAVVGFRFVGVIGEDRSCGHDRAGRFIELGQHTVGGQGVAPGAFAFQKTVGFGQEGCHLHDAIGIAA